MTGATVPFGDFGLGGLRPEDRTARQKDRQTP